MNDWTLVGLLAGTAIGLLIWNVYDIGRERGWWQRAWELWLKGWAANVPLRKDDEQ